MPDSYGNLAIDGNFTKGCFNKTATLNNTVFGVQNKECWTSKGSQYTYSKYGMSNDCKDGIGGNLANSVYKIIGMPYFKCSFRLDGFYFNDGYGLTQNFQF